MKVLFDIVHPAQVHFFKNVIRLLQQRGDEVLVTARKKDIALELLDALGIEYQCISKKGSNLFSLALELIVRNFRLWKVARRFKPDVMVARVGVAAGPVGKILGIPTVVYDDMEHAKLQAAVGMTFAKYICTGLGYYRDFGKRQFRFRGSPVLSYLAPKYFEPDSEPLRKAGLDPQQGYIFIRTVSWGASHDVGRAASKEEDLRKLIENFSRFGRVVISSEEPLPQALSQYANPVPVEQMHDLLAFASLCLVEGGTMAAEAAVLGVPAICLGTYDFGYLRALENQYKLIFRPDSLDKALEIAEELLNNEDLKQNWQEKRQKMLAESDDVTQFQLDMIDRAAKEHPVGNTGKRAS
jgi:predicted glycosyltransferase